MLLTCVGGGVALYVWVQKNFANVAVTDPVKIRQLTTDLTDITIPAEFVPQTASQFLGMHTVNYQWCPTGTCPTTVEDEDAGFTAGTLTLITFQVEGGDEAEDPEGWEGTFADENLQEQYRNFTKEVKELTIRGKPSKFFIVKGEEIPWDAVDEESNMPEDPAATPAEPPQPTEPAADATAPVTEPPATQPAPVAEAATPPAAKPPAKPGRQIVSIQGQFPGKKGTCHLTVYLLSNDYDEAKILAMLESIK
jgi:hypothetical protein